MPLAAQRASRPTRLSTPFRHALNSADYMPAPAAPMGVRGVASFPARQTAAYARAESVPRRGTARREFDERQDCSYLIDVHRRLFL